MLSLRKNSFIETFVALDQFIKNPPPGKLIDKNLNIVEKGGFKWTLLSLLAPFCRIFGLDLFEHVRIYHVANEVLALCRDNRESLSSLFIDRVKTNILNPLNEKTRNQYQTTFNDALSALDDLDVSATERRLKTLHALNQSAEAETYLNKMTIYSLTKPEESVLKITEQLQNQMIHPIVECINLMKSDPKSYHLEFLKTGQKPLVTRKLILWKLSPQVEWGPTLQKTAEFDIPFSLCIDRVSGMIKNITVLYKKIIGQGGQTKVRACYSVLTGRMMVRKKLPHHSLLTLQPLLEKGAFEEETSANRFRRGIVPICAAKRIFTSNPDGTMAPSGIQLFEPYYSNTLAETIKDGSPLLSNSLIKIHFARCLLHGLRYLHELTHPGFDRSNDSSPLISTDPFKIAHNDLSLSNILVTTGTQSTLPEAIITDLGGLSPIYKIFSLPYASPEKINFYISDNKDLDFKISFQNEYAQPSDIWSLGIVIVRILTLKSSDKRGGAFPPLDLVYKKWEDLEPEYESSSDSDKLEVARLERDFFSQVTQQDYDQNLRLLQEETDPNLQDLWHLVSQMLQLDPKKRITAQSALESLYKMYPRLHQM